MAIRQSDKVLLNGSQKGYGGFITKASYSVGFGPSITQAALTFVSESGEYTITKDSLVSTNTSKIRLGTKLLSMVPVEFNIESGSNGKILTVIYYDKSFLHLDKKIVALKGKHFANSSSSIIAIGKKYYKIEEKNGESILLNRSETTNDVRQVGEYLYTFDELMAGITIPKDGHTEIAKRARRGSNPIYKEIVGTVRSVLSSWGNILGFTFYYSENGILTFVDLTKGTEPIFPTNVDFVSKTENFNLRNSVSVGSTVYYSKAGETHGPDGTGGAGISFGPADDEDDTDYGEFEEDNDTSITLYRPSRKPEDEFANPGFAIQLAKAAAIGPAFFNFAALYLCKNNPARYSNVFGYTEVQTLPENFKEAFQKSNESFFDDYHIISYKTGGQVLADYEMTKAAFGRFLTYENNLSERSWFLYNWAIGADLKYDLQDETEYLNPNRRGGFGSDSNAGRNHRVYATVPFEEAFDIFQSVIDLDLHRSVVPLQVSTAARKISVDNGTFDPSLYFAAVLKNINFSAIFNRVRFIYQNRASLRVEGRYIDPSRRRGSDGSDSGNNDFTTSAVEATRSIEPNYSSNTIRSLVNFDTAEHNESSLANIVLPNTNIIFSATEDAVGTYGLTGNLSDYPLVSYDLDKPDVQKTFVVKNIDIEGYNATIAKGLQKMDISIQPDGVTTTYTIGNKNFVLPGDEILIGPKGYVFENSIANQTIKPSFAAIKTALSSIGVKYSRSNVGKTNLGN